MELSLDGSIAALASASGSAARGIVRLSGDSVRQILSGWFQPFDECVWQRSRTATVHRGVLTQATAKVSIPVQVHFWPNHRSYTGQPVAELHLPGAPPLLELVLAEAHRRGARPARPGEFTLRAFLAGKLDLLQAEAVLGVIDAHDHTELSVALVQLAGGLSGRLAGLRSDLLELLADLEAGLDFIEEDIEFVSRNDVIHRIDSARSLVEDLLKQACDRMQSRPRLKVVLAGLPNAGKSTLFNHLAQNNSAIVSTTEGTTRDFLSAPIDWHGLGFDLVDTAGWEADATGIALAAQMQRTDQLKDADVIVWCSSAALNPLQRELDQNLFLQIQSSAFSVVRLTTQTDRIHGVPTTPTSFPGSAISVVTGHGVDDFSECLRNRLISSDGRGRQWLGMTAARCRESLESVANALVQAGDVANSLSTGDELLVVDVREALDHLGRILGTVYTEDILDRVFNKFCIGK